MTDDLVQMLLEKCTEVEEFLKNTRLLANDRSFYQQYETSLAKIQTRISRLHRELSNSKNEKKKMKSSLCMQNYYYSIGGFISEAKSQLYYIYTKIYPRYK